MIVTSPVEEIRAWTRGQVEAVSNGWWVLLVTGVVSIVAGHVGASGCRERFPSLSQNCCV